jgi:hypothetical protein
MICALVVRFVMSDCQRDPRRELGCTTCLLACGVQMWSSEAVVDDEVKVK